jgi:hypothetical protein
MKRLLNKISKDKADLLGMVNVGDTRITVAVDGDMVLGLVNGVKVVDAGLYEDFIERMVPVLTMIIAKVFRKDWKEGDTLDIRDADWDSKGLYPSKNFLTALVSDLQRHLDPKTVNVISESSPTEVPEKEEVKEVRLNINSLQDNLEKYATQIAEVARYADRAIDRAKVLTTRRLPEEMWGATKVQEYMDGVKSKLTGLELESSLLDQDAHDTVKATRRLNYRLKSGKYTEDDSKKYISKVLVPDIHESFDGAKESVSKVLYAVGNLNALEKVFQENVGNSAGLFLHTNVMDDLGESIDILSGFLSDSSEIESNVMEPIELLGSSKN